MTSPDEQRVDYIQGSTVEGLFARALKPTGEFDAELRRVGVDVQRLEPTYPLTVWYAALRIARQRVAGHLPDDQAYRLLGDRLISGFFDTLVGKMVSVGMPLLGPDATLQRLARMWRTGQPSLRMETLREADRRWRLTLHQDGVVPDFCAGILESGLTRTGVQPRVTVLERSPTHCVLQVAWDAKPAR